MQTATVEEVQADLPEMLERIEVGREVLIVRAGKPVGRLLPPLLAPGVPIAGRGKGKLVIHGDDDEHLKDFAEYMP
jgi:antitoxin (DNA-binding transcriptional repressor) of toxin-antitoxin stability system